VNSNDLAGLVEIPDESAPDFVVQQSKYLFDAGILSDPANDIWVNRYLAFYRDYTECEPKNILYLKFVHPHIYTCFFIRSNPTDVRDKIIEAGIIGGAAPLQIAEYIAMDVETVIAYEQCYYNVRNKLKSQGYVFGRLLAAIATFNHPVEENDQLWKLLSYVGGWEMFCDYLHSGSSMEMQTEVIRLLKTREGKKLLYAAHKELITAETASSILWRHAKSTPERGMLETENAKTDPVEAEYAKIEENMRKLQLIPVAVLDNPTNDIDEKRLLPAGLENLEKFKVEEE